MVWLAGLLTALLVLAADLAAQQPVDRAGLHALAGCLFLLLAPAFAVLQSFVTIRRWRERKLLQRRAEFLHRSLLGSNLVIWLFGCVALLVVAKWPQLVRENWKLNQVPLLDELALALPMLGSILLSWMVIFDAEQALEEPDATGGKRRHLVLQRLRTFTGLVLVPIALLFLSRDILAVLYPDGLDPLATCLVFLAFLAATFSLYPILLSLTWKTHAVSCPELAVKLREAAREAGLPNETFRVWDTNSTIANAVVVGVIPGLRRVFLSDQLLERFDDDEVVAIYRHELGHLVHHHLHMRIALVLIPLLALGAMAMLSDGQDLAAEYAANSTRMVVWLTGMMAFLLYVSRVVTRFVRKSEIQADLFAICRKSGAVCLRRAESYCRALLKMGAISPELFENSTSVHPSIKLRIEVIRQVLDQPDRITAFANRFRQEQQVAAGCLVALAVLAVMVGNLL